MKGYISVRLSKKLRQFVLSWNQTVSQHNISIRIARGGDDSDSYHRFKDNGRILQKHSASRRQCVRGRFALKLRGRAQWIWSQAFDTLQLGRRDSAA